MIASLRGTVQALTLEQVVVDVGGVGLAVRTTPSTLAGLRTGEPAQLATTLVVREDSLTLFGFATAEARDLFELVQSVSGVGPRIALAMLAVLDPADLRRALAGGDTATLVRVPGIGKKGAERLVLELKDKVGMVPGSGATAAQAVGTGGPWRDQLTDALEGLGFTAKQAGDAVESVITDPSEAVVAAVSAGDVTVLLRRALAVLGRSR